MNAQHALKARSHRNSATKTPEVTYRLATTKQQLEQAFELVWDAYVGAGLQDQNNQGVRLTKYHALPDAKVFVAVSKRDGEDENVIGTLTVVPDGAFGIPAEEVAGREIAEFRSQGRRVAEFVALAANEEGTKDRAILKLFRLASTYCRHAGFTTVLATLTERHIGFYRKFLSFKPIGRLAPYSMGNGTAVQVHYIHCDKVSGLLDRRAAVLERDPNWSWFSEHEADAVLLEAQHARPWNPDLLHHFRRRSRDFANQLNPKTLAILRSEYRRYGSSGEIERPAA